MTALTSLNGRFAIGTRIGSGFGLVLILLLALAIVAWSSLVSKKEQFASYAEISGGALVTAGVATEFAVLRRYALAYLEDGDRDVRAKMEKAAAEIRRDMETTAATLRDERWRAMAREIQAGVQE